MFQIQPIARHPLSDSAPEIPSHVYEQMWSLFDAIGQHWGTLRDSAAHRTRLLNFMLNRIKLNPLYGGFYATATDVLHQMQGEHGASVYEMLFVDKTAAAENPPQSPMAVTRQLVSNEFISLHLALGGFKAFGALNYCGFIAGPNIPGQAPPYRSGEAQ